MAKAVGVGGVFLKASDPEKLSAWYVEHARHSFAGWRFRWLSTDRSLWA